MLSEPLPGQPKKAPSEATVEAEGSSFMAAMATLNSGRSA